MSLAFAQQVYACSNIQMNQKMEEVEQRYVAVDGQGRVYVVYGNAIRVLTPTN